jgi:hypothetical protein
MTFIYTFEFMYISSTICYNFVPQGSTCIDELFTSSFDAIHHALFGIMHVILKYNIKYIYRRTTLQ